MATILDCRGRIGRRRGGCDAHVSVLEQGGWKASTVAA